MKIVWLVFFQRQFCHDFTQKLSRFRSTCFRDMTIFLYNLQANQMIQEFYSFGIRLVCCQPKTYSDQMSSLLFLGVIVLLLTCCGDVRSIQYIRDLYSVALQMLALTGPFDMTPCMQQAKVSRQLLLRYGSNAYNINVILCTNRWGPVSVVIMPVCCSSASEFLHPIISITTHRTMKNKHALDFY